MREEPHSLALCWFYHDSSFKSSGIMAGHDARHPTWLGHERSQITGHPVFHQTRSLRPPTDALTFQPGALSPGCCYLDNSASMGFITPVFFILLQRLPEIASYAFSLCFSGRVTLFFGMAWNAYTPSGSLSILIQSICSA
jgi:hypothetical protein